jgi:hypothetical protein
MSAKSSSVLSLVPPRRGGSFTCTSGRNSRFPIVTRPQHLSPSPSIKSELSVHLFWPKSNPCHSYKLLGGRGGRSRAPISLNLQHLIFPTLPSRARTAQRVHICFNLPDLDFSPHLPLATRHSSLSPKPLLAITYEDCSHKPLPAITYENRGDRGFAYGIRTSFNLRHLVFSSSRTFDIPTLQPICHRTNGHTTPFVSEWLARPCASLNRSFTEFLRSDRTCAA